MSVSVSNLVQGPATLYIGAFSAVEPLDTAVNSTPQASAWTDLGGTMGGAEITISQEYKELEVDQIVDVPGRRLVKRDMSVKTNLAEPTLANLTYILNDGTVGASGTGYAGTFEPNNQSSATQPTYRALIIDGYAPGAAGQRRRLIVRRVLSTDNVQFAYKKDDQNVFTVTWSAHYVSSVISPYHIVDQA